MKYFKIILDFYLKSSVHVSLSVLAFVHLSGVLLQINAIENCAYFAFFGTIVGYNFVKYDALARTQKVKMSLSLKVIAFLSFLSFIATIYFFLQLETITKIIGVFLLLVTILYTFPFFPNKKNARNWAGFKIYIVTLCWVGVTLVLPMINEGIPLDVYALLLTAQRFIMVFVLVLIFEIIDLQYDDPHLHTVPQQIGVKKTKIVGLALTVIFVLLQLVNSNISAKIIAANIVIAFIVALFLLFASEKKSKYYSTFWAESIPIFWWILLLIFG